MKRLFSTIIICAGLLIPASAVFAQTAPVQPAPQSAQSDAFNQLNAAGGTAGLTNADPRILAANVIRSVLGIVGTLFLCLMVYAGFLWMTAGGNEENTKKAKSLIFAAVIGLVIVLAAYSITIFVVWYLAQGLPTGSAPVDQGFVPHY